MHCKNCNQLVKENFCGQCGQSIKVSKINLPNFLGELTDNVFQINKGLFYTMKALFVSPGQTIKDYLSGKRKHHFKPIAYVFTLSTIYFLLSQLVHIETFIHDFVRGYMNAPDLSTVESEKITTLIWFTKNYAYTMLLLLPLNALASYLAFFGSGINYLEHFVLNAYITGQQSIIYASIAILSLLIPDDDLLSSISLCVSICYTFCVFWQFFSNQKKVAVVLRSVLTYILFILMVSLTLFMIFPVIT